MRLQESKENPLEEEGPGAMPTATAQAERYNEAGDALNPRGGQGGRKPFPAYKAAV